jgi:hypothetical protein
MEQASETVDGQATLSDKVTGDRLMLKIGLN